MASCCASRRQGRARSAAAAVVPGLVSAQESEPEPEQYTQHVGALCGGNDAAPPEADHTLASARSRCNALGAAGFTFSCAAEGRPLGLCYFKTPAVVANSDPEWTTFRRVGGGLGPDVAERRTEGAPTVNGAAASGDVGDFGERCAASLPVSPAEDGGGDAEEFRLAVAPPEHVPGRRLPVCAFDCVDPRATDAARHIVERMLERCEPCVPQRLAACGCSIAVIGHQQVTSDMPPHNFLKGMQASLGDRSYDAGCRGVGGTPSAPCTSVGEENLLGNVLDGGDPHFRQESILVHEFSHAVMNIGVSDEMRERIAAAYEAAKESGRLDNDSYMMANPEEFWAEGAQAWFHASDRTDVNCGINTRTGLREALPDLAAMMEETFGDGAWSYRDENVHGWG